MNDWLKKLISGYYNITPPETFSGKSLPHYSENIDKTKHLSNYYNIGNEEPIGVINKDSIYVRPTRFHNDPNFKSYSEQIYNNIDWNELNNKGKKYKNSLLDLVGNNNNYFNPYTEK